jgi:hypothetical protein
MTRVTGIGLSFEARDPAALRARYRTHLGIDAQECVGFAFRWSDSALPDREGVTVWSVFPAGSGHFDPSPALIMDPEGNRLALWEPPAGRFPG